jgi:hypothetical protein
LIAAGPLPEIDMTPKKSAFVILGVLILATLALVVSRGWRRELLYGGAPLIKWLDGTMHKRGFPSAIGPEAVPQLIRITENRPTLLQWIYSRLYRVSQPVNKSLPKAVQGFSPVQGFSLMVRFNAARELSRLAPGTESETQAVAALLSLGPQVGKFYQKQYWFAHLSAFTNCSDKIVPVLLTGVTNPATFDSSVTALKRFGYAGVPELYRMAKTESGFIRPAELALQKIDEKAYLRLLDEKSSRLSARE